MPEQGCQAEGRKLPSDELSLAAVERALRHDPGGHDAVPMWTILDHLALRRRSRAARHVGERLDAMRAAGLVSARPRHGVRTWALGEAGERRLRAAARAGGGARALPESPQHRAWRLARLAAEQELARFRGAVERRLEQVAELLAAEQPPHSDAWLVAGERLAHACRRLASASHCLYEWDEPDDARPDVDRRIDRGDELLDERERAHRRALRAGRRNVRLWDDWLAS